MADPDCTCAYNKPPPNDLLRCCAQCRQHPKSRCCLLKLKNRQWCSQHFNYCNSIASNELYRYSKDAITSKYYKIYRTHKEYYETLSTDRDMLLAIHFYNDILNDIFAKEHSISIAINKLLIVYFSFRFAGMTRELLNNDCYREKCYDYKHKFISLYTNEMATIMVEELQLGGKEMPDIQSTYLILHMLIKGLPPDGSDTDVIHARDVLNKYKIYAEHFINPPTTNPSRWGP